MFPIELLKNAVLNNDLEEIQNLINTGVDVNEPLEDYDTVLMVASMEGHIDAVRILVNAGADVNIISYHGDNALVHSIRGCWEEIFDYLAPLASLDVKKWAETNTLIGSASDTDANPRIVDLLSSKGADLNDTNEENEGQTSLMVATDFRNVSFVKALIKANVDVNLKDYEGQTPLMIAAKFRNSTEEKMNGVETTLIELLQMLIDAGGDLHAIDNNGKTALIHASESGTSQCIRLLLEHGANVNIKDVEGNSALSYAKSKSKNEVIKILVDTGAME